MRAAATGPWAFLGYRVCGDDRWLPDTVKPAVGVVEQGIADLQKFGYTPEHG
jgi:hypothetical protein